MDMLAEYVSSVDGATAVGAAVVQLNSGSGRVAAAFISRARLHPERRQSLWCAERYSPAVEAIRRELPRDGSIHAPTDSADHAGTTVHLAHAHGAQLFHGVADADLVTIRIPTEKLPTQQLIWDAFNILRVGGTCILAGGTNEGVKPAVRMLDTLFGSSTVEAQHSGHRLVRATRRDAQPTSVAGFDSPYLSPDVFRELHVSARGEQWLLHTRPGVFSWEHLDEATTLLADAMEVRAGESVLDIGTGAGLLGLIAARMSGTGEVLMLDADSEAVRCASRSIAAASIRNAEAAASDVTSAAGDRTFDVVLSNPPFHQGKAVDLVLPRRFIGEAYNRLVPGGRLYIVANRTLPYERVITERFGAVRVLHDGQRFKVLGATR